MTSCPKCEAPAQPDDAFCAKCGTPLSDVALDFATHARASVVGKRADLPPVKCPKCGNRQHDPEACDRCGLVFALAPKDNAPWDRPPPGKEAAYAEATRLWAVVASDHTNEDAHRQFCDHCREAGVIEVASRRYRHRLADYPDDALAQTFNAEIVASARSMAQSMRMGQEPIDPEALRRQMTMVVLVVVILLMLIMGVLWW